MGVSVICGGQWGSEGKGKVALEWAKRKLAKVCVRVGGPNSGHTVYAPDKNGVLQKYVLRQLPVGAVLPYTTCVIAAGSYINVPLLIKELTELKFPFDRLKIDNNAYVIDPNDPMYESIQCLRENIGSTLSGTGSALYHRVSRMDESRLARNCTELKGVCVDTKEYLRRELDRGINVIVEGTQGYGLSVLHSEDYPYVTARDTTAAGILSEVGLSPFDVTDIVLVCRSYPIRVAGNSGPMRHEIDWETVSKRQGLGLNLHECTSVTNRPRRVADMDAELIRKAVIANKPNYIVMNHMDYIPRNQWFKFLAAVEDTIGCSITHIGVDSIGIRSRGEVIE